MKILTNVKSFVQKNALSLTAVAATVALSTSANTATSIWLGQPEAPAELKKFSKIR